jgi:hypothetical protein
MPHDLHVIRAGDFIRLDGEGSPDLAASRRALAELARAMEARDLDRAILDIREVQSRLSPTDIYELATTFAATGFRRAHRLAIVCRATRIDNADFFAMLTQNRGWDVRAFDEFEEAFEWLTTQDPIPHPRFDGGPSAHAHVT